MPPAAAVNPLTVSDAGGLLMLNQTGEFLVFDSQPEAGAAADAGAQLEPQRRRQRLDLQAAPGRQVQQRRTDDRRRRRLHVPAAVGPEERLQRAVDVHRRADARPASRRWTRRRSQFHLESPNGNFPYLVSSDNYNAIIVPKGTDFGKWQNTFVGTGAVQARELHAERQAPRSSPTRTTGGQAAAGRAPQFSFYAEPAAA